MPTSYEIGPFRLDAEAEVLFRGSEPVAVGQRAVALLRVLAERAGTLVSREALIEAAWPSLAVEDSNLSVQIAALRRLFAQEPGGEGWIETLPRRGYRFLGPVVSTAARPDSLADETTASEISPALPLADKPSIAVMPFENLSGDAEQDYFSDGMAEDLITDISKISGLFVAARNSSFAFRGKAVDVKEIAKDLGVRHILEGSVRKMGVRLRVNAQLIDAADGGHVWAERYDGNMEDIFEFQDDIRGQIVSALRVSLSPNDPSRSERKRTESARAYDLCLRGRAHYHRFRTTEDLFEAINCFEQAIDTDPHFADAFGYLSRCYFYGWIRVLAGFEDGLERASELAEKGVALDGDSAIALARLGWVQMFQRRYDPAIANLEKALALAPDDADVSSTFAQVLNLWGDPERGRRLQEKAFSKEVYPPPNWDFHLGLSHFLLRNYDLAIASLSRNAPGLRLPILACAYVELGRLDEAKDAMRKQLEATPYMTVAWYDQRAPIRLDDVRARILDGLRKAGMPEV